MIFLQIGNTLIRIHIPQTLSRLVSAACMRWYATIFSPEAVPTAAAKMVAMIANERIVMES